VAKVNGRVSGRRLVAFPFSDVCPPLGDVDSLLPLIEEHRQNNAWPLELRADVSGLPGAVMLPRFHWHVVQLDEGAERKASSSFKRNARNGRKAGVTIERRVDRAGLDAFFRLHVRTRQHQGVPTQPRKFVRGFESLFAAGLGHVALAMHDGRPVAASVFFGMGRTLTYKYGASDRAALHLRPNNVLFAEQIAWGREQGYEVLDLGRTDFGHEGLRRFKKSLGSDERILVYTFVGISPESGNSVAPRALALVIKHSPPGVGQAIGAALYRHAW
jgi:hypothetical protein